VRSIRVLLALSILAAACYGAAISFPGVTFVINGTNGSGISFTYNGTLTQNDTIAFSTSGLPCLQTGGGYCTNPAGVVVTPGGGWPAGSANNFSGSFGGFSGSYTYGAILMSIPGVGTKQVFPASAANGAGSSTPPSTLNLPATPLSALGFSTFSVTNPTITFYFADDLYSDNTGSVTLTQATGSVPATPVPASWILIVCGLVLLGLLAPRLRKA